MLKHLLNFSLLVLFMGCASFRGSHSQAQFVAEIDGPISEIRARTAALMPTGQRSVSSNGREMLSHFFIVDKKGEYKPAGEANERYFAHVYILGDRRPYTVELSVAKESRLSRQHPSAFHVTGYDERLAKELAKRLRTELTKRREDLNIIDDFRIY